MLLCIIKQRFSIFLQINVSYILFILNDYVLIVIDILVIYIFSCYAFTEKKLSIIFRAKSFDEIKLLIIAI